MPSAGTAAVVLVASGHRPFARVLPPDVDLGRQVVADGVALDLDDERMSREHARVRYEDGAWIVTDLNSRNGTYLAGERVVGTRRTHGVALLRTGHSVFGLLPDATGHPLDLEELDGPEMTRALDQLRTFAAAGRDVLLDTEAGNAKLRAARAYHAASARAAGPFIAVNCGALPDGVGERLLFGARNATFSNATRSIGHVQMADGGTLFLDEVSDLDAGSQQRLLRALQTRELVPVGAASGAPFEVGVVTATLQEVLAGRDQQAFLPALAAALSQCVVRLPPLRERPLDIVRAVQRECSRAKVGAHAKLLEACCLRPWPGNERELESAVREAIKQAVAAARDVVRFEDLASSAGISLESSAGLTAVERPKQPRIQIDRDTVVDALARANGVVSVAARALGLHRTELYRLMESHGLRSEARED